MSRLQCSRHKRQLDRANTAAVLQRFEQDPRIVGAKRLIGTSIEVRPVHRVSVPRRERTASVTTIAEC
jgi:hypothetical protein